jgi:hypothetical protein
MAFAKGVLLYRTRSETTDLVTRAEGASLPQTRDYVAQGVRRSQGLEPPEHLEHANRS